MVSRFLVNDSKEVKKCLSRESEILKAVKPYTLTGTTEVKQNRFSVIPREGLRIQQLAATWTVHHSPDATSAKKGVNSSVDTNTNNRFVFRPQPFTFRMCQHLGDFPLLAVHANGFTPRDFVVVAEQMQDAVDEQSL